MACPARLPISNAVAGPLNRVAAMSDAAERVARQMAAAVRHLLANRDAMSDTDAMLSLTAGQQQMIQTKRAELRAPPPLPDPEPEPDAGVTIRGRGGRSARACAPAWRVETVGRPGRNATPPRPQPAWRRRPRPRHVSAARGHSPRGQGACRARAAWTPSLTRCGPAAC